jgi:hypothetical protein
VAGVAAARQGCQGIDLRVGQVAACQLACGRVLFSFPVAASGDDATARADDDRADPE